MMYTKNIKDSEGNMEKRPRHRPIGNIGRSTDHPGPGRCGLSFLRAETENAAQLA